MCRAHNNRRTPTCPTQPTSLNESPSSPERVAASGARPRSRCSATAGRSCWREGVPRRTIPAEEADARMLFRTLADIAGPALLGSVKEIPAGMYYHRSSPGG